jgi:hypothetical protein
MKVVPIDALEEMTPVSLARPGLLGTLFTSLIAGAIIGIFLRKK